MTADSRCPKQVKNTHVWPWQVYEIQQVPQPMNTTNDTEIIFLQYQSALLHPHEQNIFQNLKISLTNDKFPWFFSNSKFPWLFPKFPDFSLTLNFPDFSLTSGNPDGEHLGKVCHWKDDFIQELSSVLEGTTVLNGFISAEVSWVDKLYCHIIMTYIIWLAANIAQPCNIEPCNITRYCTHLYCTMH